MKIHMSLIRIKHWTYRRNLGSKEKTYLCVISLFILGSHFFKAFLWSRSHLSPFCWTFFCEFSNLKKIYNKIKIKSALTIFIIKKQPKLQKQTNKKKNPKQTQRQTGAKPQLNLFPSLKHARKRRTRKRYMKMLSYRQENGSHRFHSRDGLHTLTHQLKNIKRNERIIP